MTMETGEQLVIYEDITKHERMDQALRESEERFRQFFENELEYCYMISPDGLVIDLNKAAFRALGYKKNELIGKPLKTIYAPESLPKVEQSFSRWIENGKLDDEELIIITKEGERRTVLLSAGTVKNKDGEILYSVSVQKDITKRKQAEEKLRVSEEKFRDLAEFLPETVFEVDTEGNIIFVNRKAFDQFGYTQQDFELGLNSIDMLAPEERDRASKNIIAALNGEKLGLSEYKALRKDGSTFPVLLKSDPIIHEGKPIGLRGLIIDISEKIRLMDQLLQAQKMEAVGTLAGGIAHDFNNLLMGIMGNASLMLLDIDTDHPHCEMLKNIEEYVRNGSALTKQLLGFAREGKYEVKPTDLNNAVKKSSEMFGRTRKEITIHTKYQEELWPAEVDQGQIEQVLLNLYVNAWHAMPGGGDLYLSTENVILDENYAQLYEVEAGKYIKISVADIGVGMDETTQQRVFDPFFTTKEMGRGAGLGLASAYGIVRNHMGIIEVSSKKGEGTVFDIYLPASEKDALREKEVAEKIIKGSKTILLIDDEDMIIDVGKRMLAKLGYNIMIAKSGREALEIYRENQKKIDMVILDMIMPGMGGGETYDKLKEINPGIKVLLSSGYSINGQAAEILNRGCSEFIQKPFSLKELSQKLREILDKK